MWPYVSIIWMPQFRTLRDRLDKRTWWLWGCHLVKATLLLGPGVGLNDATTGGDVWMIGISFIYSWWLLVIILFGYSDDHGCYDLVSWCVHYWYFSMKTYGTPPDAQEIILHPFLVHHWGSGSAISDRHQAIGGSPVHRSVSPVILGWHWWAHRSRPGSPFTLWRLVCLWDILCSNSQVSGSNYNASESNTFLGSAEFGFWKILEAMDIMTWLDMTCWVTIATINDNTYDIKMVP